MRALRLGNLPRRFPVTRACLPHQGLANRSEKSVKQPQVSWTHGQVSNDPILRYAPVLLTPGQKPHAEGKLGDERDHVHLCKRLGEPGADDTQSAAHKVNGTRGRHHQTKDVRNKRGPHDEQTNQHSIDGEEEEAKFITGGMGVDCIDHQGGLLSRLEGDRVHQGQPPMEIEQIDPQDCSLNQPESHRHQ